MNLIVLLLPLITLLQSGAPQFEVQLHTAHESVQPGGQTELAIQLKLTEDWHLYHPIILDIGSALKVDFELPAGATVEPLRFSTPYLESEKDGDKKVEYLGLGDGAIILTTLKLAKDVNKQPLQIKVRITGQARKEKSVPVSATTTLTLPVSDESPAATDVEFFEDARYEMPPALDKAEYIEGSRLLVSHTKVPLGQSAMLAAVIKVKSAHHIQDRNPGVEGLIPSRLFIGAPSGITFDRSKENWPKAHVREMEYFGKVREQSGEFIIQAPFTVSKTDFKPGHVRLPVLFQYQCCTDDGQCFAPIMAEGFVEFEVVPTDAPAVKTDDPIVEKLAKPEEATALEGQGASSGTLPHNVLFIFLGAFVGGAILNIMPCVLPVISLKILGFMQQAGDDRGRIFKMGLVYAAGIMASFAVLAALMVFAGVAWGGLMQSSGFLIGMCAVVFAFALSLLGVFEVQLPGAATSAAGEVASKEGYGGAFFNGILATLLATPCVAPFLGSAVGLLTQLPAAIGATGIMIAGLGLATPYVLLTAFPAWLRFLPKPGPWMVTFKQIVGFILVAVVIWLVSILAAMEDHGRQAELIERLATGQIFEVSAPPQLLGTLGMLLAVGTGCWILGRITLSDSFGRTARRWITALVIMIGGGYLSFWLFAERESKIPWHRWEPGVAERLADEGYTVYIDYTATWCLTCQANKKFVLETDRIANKCRELGVYPIKADFTTYDREMFAELKAYDKVGVPLNLVYPAGKPDEAIVLPEVLTFGIVEDALDKAGPSEKIPDFWPPKP
ncbi:MAG: cytochrome c biogenesis protein CcdA [Planctomycetota bacterium]